MNCEENEAYKKAINMLNRRFLSEKEIRRKLFLKETSEEVINIVVNKLLELNYLNDQRLAEQVFRNYKKKEQYGLFYIKEKLKLRGLNLPENLQDFNEEEIVFKLLNKKKQLKQDWNKKKFINFLKYRGFSNEILTKIYYLEND